MTKELHNDYVNSILFGLVGLDHESVSILFYSSTFSRIHINQRGICTYRLARFQAATTHQKLDRAVFSRYFAFLAGTQFLIFSLLVGATIQTMPFVMANHQVINDRYLLSRILRVSCLPPLQRLSSKSEKKKVFRIFLRILITYLTKYRALICNNPSQSSSFSPCIASLVHLIPPLT